MEARPLPFFFFFFNRHLHASIRYTSRTVRVLRQSFHTQLVSSPLPVPAPTHRCKQTRASNSRVDLAAPPRTKLAYVLVTHPRTVSVSKWLGEHPTPCATLARPSSLCVLPEQPRCQESLLVRCPCRAMRLHAHEKLISCNSGRPSATLRWNTTRASRRQGCRVLTPRVPYHAYRLGRCGRTSRASIHVRSPQSCRSPGC